MKSGTWVLIYIVVGAMAFWAPDIATHAISRYEFSAKEARALTVLLPCIVFASYRILFRFRGKQESGPSIALFMLIGIWMLGSLAMMISASFSGGGFAKPGLGVWIVIALGILPPFTFIMSAYNGNLFGLLLASILLFIMHFRFEKSHWLIPPFRRISNYSKVTGSH